MLTSLDRSRAAVRTGTRPSRSRLEIAVAPAAVRIARRWAAGQLAACCPPPSEEIADAAVLAVSELVTNAIMAMDRGGTSRVWLVIVRGAGTVRIEVHDSSAAPLPAEPLPACPRDGADVDAGGWCDEGGRGLGVVAALATRWGWQPGPLGKVVWCELTG